MRRWRGALPYVVLLCEVLIFHRKALFSSQWGIPWDLRSYHLPLATFVADSFAKLQLPLWDPYTYCGFPFFANIQAQIFYPPAWLAVLASNLTGGTQLADFLEWQIALHVWLAGVFTFWLLRSLEVSRMAALAGATIFQLGGFFASQTQHLGAMNGAAWLPLAWLAVIKLGRCFSWRWTGALAAALALAVLAGFPAISFVVGASSIVLAIVLVALRQARLRLLTTVAAAGIWSVLLAAVQLLPTSQLSRLSVAKYRGDWLGTGGGLPLASLVSLVSPNYYNIFDLSKYSLPWNPTFLYLYLGITGLILALSSVFLWRIKSVRPFLAMLPLMLLWMLGDSTAIGRWLLPKLGSAFLPAVYPEFAMSAFLLVAAVLAGLAAGRFFSRWPTWAGAAVVAVLAAELIWVGSTRPMNTFSLEQEPGVTTTHFDGSQEVLDRMRYLSRQSVPPARIDTVDDSMAWAMGAPLTGVPTANGNDPLALSSLMQVRRLFTGGERWGRYYQVKDADSSVLPLLNVRFLLSRGPIQSVRYKKIAEIPGRAVYEDASVLPRFFLAGVAQNGAVNVVRYAPAEVILEVTAPSPAFLASSETWYPGWRANIDDAPAPLVVTNLAFRGVMIPAGKHTVTMRFEPAVLIYGTNLSLIGLGLLIAALVFGDNMRRLAPWTSSSN